MNKVGIIAALIILSIFLAGCTQPTKEEEPIIQKCGNGVCEADERCDTCSQDCGCKSGEYCDIEIGICKIAVCGNNVKEKGETEENCCIDAGCSGTKICDIPSNKCIEKIEITDSEIEEIINQYLTDNKVEAQLTLISKKDSYYEKDYAIEALFDCEGEICKGKRLVAYISQDKTVLSLTRE